MHSILYLQRQKTQRFFHRQWTEYRSPKKAESKSPIQNPGILRRAIPLPTQNPTGLSRWIVQSRRLPINVWQLQKRHTSSSKIYETGKQHNPPPNPTHLPTLKKGHHGPSNRHLKRPKMHVQIIHRFWCLPVQRITENNRRWNFEAYCFIDAFERCDRGIVCEIKFGRV